jgi:phenylalanyl-tRNA synthetase beta subunit
VPDIVPYKSMIDGKMVTSRSEHRRHLKAHGCEEVGNDDPSKHIQREKPVDTRLERIKHMVNTRLTNEQADRILRDLRSQANFTNPHRRG